jgi:hypothetical protein
MTAGGVDAFAKAIELDGLHFEMHDRVSAAATSYVLMVFYFEQGIPDKRWRQSPGKNGSSISYFPDFRPRHFRLKGWFDFYADVFYYKLFSAWDLMGHVLNVRHSLKLPLPDFVSAMEALGRKDPVGRKAWDPIFGSHIFRDVRQIRNKITHGYSPNTTGMSVSREESILDGKKSITYGFGLKKYLPSNEILSMANKGIDLFERSLSILTGDHLPPPNKALLRTRASRNLVARAADRRR